MLQNVDLIAFDLDDTLAPSKSPAPEAILQRLLKLLEEVPVAVISGGTLEQFQTQLIAPLEALLESQQPHSVEQLTRLHLLPTCGTKYFTRRNSSWVALYEEQLSFEDRALAAQTLEREARALGLWAEMAWGNIIDDRGTQITFSALGQRAPIEVKTAWDPSGAKKEALRKAVAEQLTHLEVRSGGSTSVDVTRKGIDKAYGMQQLAKHTGIALENMLFIGDRLDPEGNDYPVQALGVPCRAVTGWEETVTVIDSLLAEQMQSIPDSDR